MEAPEPAVGPRGQVAHPALFAARPPRVPRVVRHAEGVASVLGLSVANTHVVEGARGLIVFDTGHDECEGEQLRDLIRGWSDRPISAVIYTHSHYSHGTGALAPLFTPDAMIIAHPRLETNLWRALAFERPAWQRRVRAQYGLSLPREGPDADPSEAEPTHGRSASAYLPPTRLVSLPEETILVDGLALRFHTQYPWDTDDTLIVWDEERRVVVHNHVTPNFPNMYSIAGGPFRDPVPWLEGIDLMRRLAPALALGPHGPPLVGEAEVREGLTVFRDALQFVFDQTVRGINRGLGPLELLEFVRLPDELAAHPKLQQTYSEIGFHIRAVFSGLFGWYGGEASELKPLSTREMAVRLVDALGGVPETIERARKAAEDGDARWSAWLARMALQTEPGSDGAGDAYVAALRFLAQRTPSWTTRNALLTQARHWEAPEAVHERIPAAEFGLTLDIALRAPPLHFPRIMAACLVPERLADRRLSCAFRLAGETGFTFRLRRGIAEVEPFAAADADMALCMTRSDFLLALLGHKTWREVITDEQVCRGCSPYDAMAFLALFEPWGQR